MYLFIFIPVLFYFIFYFRIYVHLTTASTWTLYIHISRLLFFFFIFSPLILVMGLQRLFSATTAVVGLFISVDYGLCDEFRCRGSNIIATAPLPTVGWQGRAMWTLVYVAGIALWTLHLSLLEGNIVTPVNVIFVYILLLLFCLNRYRCCVLLKLNWWHCCCHGHRVAIVAIVDVVEPKHVNAENGWYEAMNGTVTLMVMMIMMITAGASASQQHKTQLKFKCLKQEN